MFERTIRGCAWAGLLAAALFSVACSGKQAPATSAAPQPVASALAAAEEKIESLDYVEVITGRAGPEDRLPMIVAIHGLGDSPEGFSGLIRGFGKPARIILPRGPEKYHNGYSWFPIRNTDWEDGAWVTELSRSAQRIAHLVGTLTRKRPTVGKPLVMGFSQGGMLTYTLAAHHPEVFGFAVPVGGFLPKSLTPEQKDVHSMPRLVAFNGEADTIIPFQLALSTLKRLKPLKVDVQLKGFPKVAHRIPPPMRAAVYTEIGAYLDSLPKANAP